MKKTTFREILEKTEKDAVLELLKRIRDASRIAKVATTKSGRRIAYGVKLRLLRSLIELNYSISLPIHNRRPK